MKKEIAIVGLGCRFPGDPGWDGFCRTIRDGQVHFSDVPAARWNHRHVFSLDSHDTDKTYAAKASFLDDPFSFAADHFGISPRRARLMDPQQRLLLEVVREALEDGGLERKGLPKQKTGVFVGASVSDHKFLASSRVQVDLAARGWLGRAAPISDEDRAALVENVVPTQAYNMIGQQLNMIAANVSKTFDLHGPALSLDAACSSALVALHEAILHLRAGLLDAAVVGGVYVILDPTMLVCFSRIGALSRTDVCRPFDEAGDGFVLGEGAGAVVLKRLDDALRDGDHIWAVVRGIGMNNDGHGGSPITPRREGQEAALGLAYEDAAVSPASVGLLEAHGTATEAGDKTEMAALRGLFRSQGSSAARCALTSVKANIGHCLAASGMASLIKAALALSRGFIPPQPGLQRLREDLGIESSGLFVSREPMAWSDLDGQPRRAGVSSFGFGGTNVHVVLEAAKASRPARLLPAASLGSGPSSREEPFPFLFSVPERSLMVAYLKDVASLLAEFRESSLEDVAFTLACHRRPQPFRLALVAGSREALLGRMEAAVRALAAGDHPGGEGTFFGEAPGEDAFRPEAPGSDESLADACRAWVGGAPVDFAGRFPPGSGSLTPLPPSPLARERYWILSRPEGAADQEDAPKQQHASAGAEQQEVSVVSKPELLGAVSAVTAMPLESLRREQKLVEDLGFDSLMVVDLFGRLGLPGASAIPRDLVSNAATLGDLIDRLASAASTGSEPAAPATAEGRRVSLSLATHPWIEDHHPGGMPVLPLAAAIDLALSAGRDAIGGDQPLALSNFRVAEGVRLGQGTTVLKIWLGAPEQDGREPEQAVSLQLGGGAGGALAFAGRFRELANGELAPLRVAEEGRPAAMDPDAFYRRCTFYGPRMHAVVSRPTLGDAHVEGRVRVARPGEIASREVDVLALDGALQLALFWTLETEGRAALPESFAEYRCLAPMPAGGELSVLAVLTRSEGDSLEGDFDLRLPDGRLAGQLRGLRARLLPAESARPAPPRPDPSTWKIESFPEVEQLRRRREAIEAIEPGLLPYFKAQDGVARETVIIGGREYLNFASYNYLGLSGDPAINTAAARAIEQYGTSVSASRIASGEKRLHQELEEALARFLGCEDSIVFVGGHGTNVTVIGHLFGPEDWIIHDSLAHDSILGGSRLSGARRRAFPHNDAAALERILQQVRPQARRILIAVEGVYSLDGDTAPLDRLIALKKQYGALLLVDEAHSIGVLGETGRGIGELFGADRHDVDFWMGTLSKALASCGGYIAGSRVLIDYLKYTAPGFVFSVGLSPANAAASLAALRRIDAMPSLVTTLQQRAAMFLELCRKRRINTGYSQGSAVVAVIVGGSTDALMLSRALLLRGINVQPILYPAVEEGQARLRFFLTARHSEEQIRTTIDLLDEELTRAGVGRVEPVGLTADVAT